MRKIAKTVEIILRHALVYPLLRLFLRNPRHDGIIDIQSIRSLLILRIDGIGDMIVTTPILRKLKEKNPQLTLGVFASPRNAEIIRNNSFVNEIYIVHSNPWKLWKELRRCKSHSFDVVINFVFNRTTSLGLIANYVAPKALKVGPGSEKYRMYFNRLLTLDRTRLHMIEILAGVADEVFGTSIAEERLSPELFIPESAHLVVENFLRHRHLHRIRGTKVAGSYMLVNFAAADAIRHLSVEQTVSIIKAVKGWSHDFAIVLCPPGEGEKAQRILEKLNSGEAYVYPPSGRASLLEIASLIKGARYVVTCDTSIVHFASAVKTPVMALFAPSVTTPHEWQPFGVRYQCLYAENGMGVASIPVDRIVRNLAVFESLELLSPRTSAL
jgi:ADP-heptose:LPS heptosyltransferase